jgi:hypothetical protein
MHEHAYHVICSGSIDAVTRGSGTRITDRKMVYGLFLVGYQVEITVNLIVVEGADAGRTQSKCFSGEIQAVAKYKYS